MKPPRITKRMRGQSAIFEGYEWIYAPFGLRESTWRQIEELRAQGYKIRVIQWPFNRDADPPAHFQESGR